MPRTPHDLGEFGLIDQLTSVLPAAGGDVVQGVGDDCAVIDDGGDRLLLITTDLMAEGVHFLPDADPEAVGRKLVAVNASDVAAMGGEPRQAVVAMALPPGLAVARLEGLYRGMAAACARYGVDLVGGDTTASRSGLVLTLTVTGRVTPAHLLRRDGARVGDRVLVSGTIGDSAAGLALLVGAAEGRAAPDLADEHGVTLCDRHLRPEARVALGRALAARGGVTAAIDLSDGLGSDLGHVCRRSHVGAEVQVHKLPVSSALQAFCSATGADAVVLAVSGGEDYELCLTADPDAVTGLRAAAADLGVPLTDVGGVVEDDGVRWLDREGTPREVGRGWDHFVGV